MDSYGSGFVQALGNDNIAEGAVQSGHLDHIKALVGPVNISCKRTRPSVSLHLLSSSFIVIVILHDHTCYPVNSDALHPANTVGYHIFPPRLIPLGSADGTQTHVHPVDCVIL